MASFSHMIKQGSRMLAMNKDTPVYLQSQSSFIRYKATLVLHTLVNHICVLHQISISMMKLSIILKEKTKSSIISHYISNKILG